MKFLSATKSNLNISLDWRKLWKLVIRSDFVALQAHFSLSVDNQDKRICEESFE